MEKIYILASLSNVLQHQMPYMPLTSNIMLNLKEIFGDQGHAARQDTMRTLLMPRWLKELKFMIIV
jgi:hypothetical protein